MNHDQPIEAVTLAPPFNLAFVRAEHPEGELEFLGDALGCDCMVVRFVDGWARMFAGDGSRNEDWYGWGAEVLAPCDGIVERISKATSTNRPGIHQGGPATTLVVCRDDGLRVLYAHIDGIRVEEGERVAAGQPVAAVGNNGFSWYPHLHIGAWREETPLQIRFDLRIQGQRAAANPDYFGGQQPKLDAGD